MEHVWLFFCCCHINTFDFSPSSQLEDERSAVWGSVSASDYVYSLFNACIVLFNVSGIWLTSFVLLLVFSSLSVLFLVLVSA